MERLTCAPRPSWQATVEGQGLIWHTPDGKPYWAEGTYYSFTRVQIAEIEKATADVYDLMLGAGEHVIANFILGDFGIPKAFHSAIADAWEAEPPALNYGRFDFGYDGKSPPKLFEFNADTPTSLLEASVIQWYWKQDAFWEHDQFNSIHETLVAKYRDLADHLPGQRLMFAHHDDPAGEDTLTVSYMRDIALEAGIETDAILMADIGWDARSEAFVDMAENPMWAIQHLYPWEWLINEEFGPQILKSLDRTIWIEPIWKMIWSNKAILPVLHDLYPDHPNLLGARREKPEGVADYVVKPIMAREGANVTIIRDGQAIAESEGDYGEEGVIYQELYPLPETAPGVFPVIGSWIVDGVPCGMGIREDGLITGNAARFVPHVID